MALMTVATEMVVAWDHGVLSVVFSVCVCVCARARARARARVCVYVAM